MSLHWKVIDPTPSPCDKVETRSHISAFASPSSHARRGGSTSVVESGPRIQTFHNRMDPSYSFRGSTSGNSRRQLCPHSPLQQQRTMSANGRLNQSPARIFDQAVRFELTRQRRGCPPNSNTGEAREAVLESLTTLSNSAQATSQAMSFTMEGQPKTAKEELEEAVSSLRRAEASLAFGGAVRAAQEAAAAAPRGLEEEAAAAGARGFGRTTKVSSIEEVHGIMSQGGKPIEVVGYVGITRPKYAY